MTKRNSSTECKCGSASCKERVALGVSNGKNLLPWCQIPRSKPEPQHDCPLCYIGAHGVKWCQRDFYPRLTDEQIQEWIADGRIRTRANFGLMGKKG